MIFAIDKQIVQQTASTFTLVDDSLWGLNTNPARNTRALVLFVTRTDKNGVRTLLGNTPNVTDVVVVTSWTINSLDDGWIEKILFSVVFWNSGQAYVVGDVIYNVADTTFYKCILNHTNHIPPNGTYWIPVTQANLYVNELSNLSAQMQISVMNDLVTPTIEDRKNTEFQRVADDFISDMDRAKDFNEADFLDSLLEAAYSALNNNRPAEAEIVVRAITNYVLEYGLV